MPSTPQVPDAPKLIKFFASPLTRSSFGAQLERLNDLSSGHRECPRCDGEKWVTRRVAVCGHCVRGYIGDDKCRRCHGSRVLELHPDDPASGYETPEVCPTCRGWGVVARRGHEWISPEDITARPTGSSRDLETLHTEPDLDLIENHNEVATRLANLSETHQQALTLYYGAGPVWHFGDGPLWPVVIMTPVGKRLLAKHKKRQPSHLSRKLEQSAWTERVTPKGNTRVDLERHNPEVHRPERTLPDWPDLTAPELLHLLRGMGREILGEQTWQVALRQAGEIMVEAHTAWNSTALVSRLNEDDEEPTQLERLDVITERRMRVQRQLLEVRYAS